MGGLRDPISVKALQDGKNYILLESLIYKTIIAPQGFSTDFASVPKIFWNILPPNGRYRNAAILHDYMYRTGSKPKKVADKLFLEMMKELGVVWWKRSVMYSAVRLFGRGSYNGR